MTLPNGIVTCLVTFGGDLDVLGGGVTTTLEVTPSHDLVWKATGQRLVGFTVASADAGTASALRLPAVDQPGFADGNGNDYILWSYKLQMTYRTALGARQVVTKTFQPFSSQSTVDFDAIPSGVVIPTAVPPTVPLVSTDGAVFTWNGTTVALGGGGGPGGSVLTTVDVTVSYTTLVAGTLSNVLAAGVYIAPDPAATRGATPLRFGVRASLDGGSSITYVNAQGITVTATLLPGETRLFEQATDLGFGLSSGIPLPQLDARYANTLLYNLGAYPARPAAPGPYFYIGPQSVPPPDAQEGDIWYYEIGI